jgi:hypothetical protein
MSNLANLIIDDINFDVLELKRSKAKNKKRLVDRDRSIMLFGKKLRYKLSKEDYKKFYLVKMKGNKKYLQPEEATEWIERAVQGNITKKDLDMERQKEIQDMDMMDNEGIMHHPESLMEV